MKALICGGRGYTDAERMARVMDAAVERLGVTEIIQGGAPGADHLAKQWAIARGISQTEFPADWNHYGRKAGILRNIAMLEEGKPDLVIAFPGGVGTAHMTSIAKKSGIRVIELGLSSDDIGGRAG
jgi:hypothetical protein